MITFRIFRIPVGVQPVFWLLAILLGIGLLQDADRFTVLDMLWWVALVFVSVLVHELGHALVLRAYGYLPTIVLHAFGGLTTWRPQEELPPLRRIMSTLAGPLFGFLLAGAAWLLAENTNLGDGGTTTRLALLAGVWVNIVWSVFNLIPIRGLDGGQALGGFIDLTFPRWSRWITEAVYIVVGIAVAVWGIANGWLILPIFVLFFTFGHYFRRREPQAWPAPADRTTAGSETGSAPDEGDDGPVLRI